LPLWLLVIKVTGMDNYYYTTSCTVLAGFCAGTSIIHNVCKWDTINCIKPSADDTKIFQVVRNREDYTALQKDLNLLQRWSVQWQLKFNISKCKHLYFSPAHHNGTYCINWLPINIITTHSDLGIVFDDPT